jgi:hypothetical protein
LAKPVGIVHNTLSLPVHRTAHRRFGWWAVLRLTGLRDYGILLSAPLAAVFGLVGQVGQVEAKHLTDCFFRWRCGEKNKARR